LRSLKSIWFHSRNWHLRNVRKRFTWSFQSFGDIDFA
jgi:hypothetical protein